MFKRLSNGQKRTSMKTIGAINSWSGNGTTTLIQRSPQEEKTEAKKEEKKPFGNPFVKYLSFMDEFKEQTTKGFMLVQGGPYETALKERITKHFLKFAAIQMGGITGFIKQKMGIV